MGWFECQSGKIINDPKDHTSFLGQARKLDRNPLLVLQSKQFPVFHVSHLRSIEDANVINPASACSWKDENVVGNPKLRMTAQIGLPLPSCGRTTSQPRPPSRGFFFPSRHHRDRLEIYSIWFAPGPSLMTAKACFVRARQSKAAKVRESIDRRSLPMGARRSKT